MSNSLTYSIPVHANVDWACRLLDTAFYRNDEVVDIIGIFVCHTYKDMTNTIAKLRKYASRHQCPYVLHIEFDASPETAWDIRVTIKHTC